MEEIDGEQRFLPYHFEMLKIIRKKEYKKNYRFDYKNRELLIQKINKGLIGKSSIVPFFPKRYYNDILSLFYNFRHGAFGPIERGRKYRILGLPRNNRDKKEIFYSIQLFSEKDETPKRKDFGWETDKYVARVRIDREIFTTKEGIIWVLLGQNMVPVKGILEDAVILGDVVGELDRQ